MLEAIISIKSEEKTLLPGAIVVFILFLFRDSFLLSIKYIYIVFYVGNKLERIIADFLTITYFSRW